MRYEIKPKNLGKYEAKIARELPRALEKARKTAATKAIAALRNRIQTMDHPPLDRKRYLNGWRVTSPRWGAIALSNEWIHAQIIETGRAAKSARPPVTAIQAWAVRKLGIPRKDAKRIAFVIARNIGERGLRGRHILFSMMPTISRIFLQETGTCFEALLGPVGHS